MLPELYQQHRATPESNIEQATCQQNVSNIENMPATSKTCQQHQQTTESNISKKKTKLTQWSEEERCCDNKAHGEAEEQKEDDLPVGEEPEHKEEEGQSQSQASCPHQQVCEGEGREL